MWTVQEHNTVESGSKVGLPVGKGALASLSFRVDLLACKGKGILATLKRIRCIPRVLQCQGCRVKKGTLVALARATLCSSARILVAKNFNNFIMKSQLLCKEVVLTFAFGDGACMRCVHIM